MGGEPANKQCTASPLRETVLGAGGDPRGARTLLPGIAGAAGLGRGKSWASSRTGCERAGGGAEEQGFGGLHGRHEAARP